MKTAVIQPECFNFFKIFATVKCNGGIPKMSTGILTFKEVTGIAACPSGQNGGKLEDASCRI